MIILVLYAIQSLLQVRRKLTANCSDANSNLEDEVSLDTDDENGTNDTNDDTVSNQTNTDTHAIEDKKDNKDNKAAAKLLRLFDVISTKKQV